jgi:anaerobic selenocysteine-containing dehydrogenase
MGNQGEARRSGFATEEPAEAAEIEGIDPDEVIQAATRFAQENPRTALAGALAIGFVVGGGLTPRLIGSVALLVGRRYASQALREAVLGAVQQQIEGAAAAVT